MNAKSRWWTLSVDYELAALAALFQQRGTLPFELQTAPIHSVRKTI